GTRNFDMENNLPLLPVAENLNDIIQQLQILCPTNYNALASNPDKADIIYDLLSSMSKIISDVDLSLLYMPKAISNISNIVDLFKPIYSRPIYIIPTIEVIDNIGELVALSDSLAKFRHSRSFWDLLLLDDNPIYYLKQIFKDTEHLKDLDIIQVIATELYPISPSGNISEVTAYCVCKVGT
ncbi:MAG: hypothetical protein ACPLX8_02165, partial [Nanopusillaceae archaeon]